MHSRSMHPRNKLATTVKYKQSLNISNEQQNAQLSLPVVNRCLLCCLQCGNIQWNKQHYWRNLRPWILHHSAKYFFSKQAYFKWEPTTDKHMGWNGWICQLAGCSLDTSNSALSLKIRKKEHKAISIQSMTAQANIFLGVLDNGSF